MSEDDYVLYRLSNITKTKNKLKRAILVKSHVWKFGLDWLSLSRVIVSTNKHTKKKKKKKKKKSDATENNILRKNSFPGG